MALYKIGAVALPLTNVFGPEVLKYRLFDSGAIVLITDSENRGKIFEIKEQFPELKYLIQVNDPVEVGEHSWTRFTECIRPLQSMPNILKRSMLDSLYFWNSEPLKGRHMHIGQFSDIYLVTNFPTILLLNQEIWPRLQLTGHGSGAWQTFFFVPGFTVFL